jgi:hypothetical protein
MQTFSKSDISLQEGSGFALEDHGTTTLDEAGANHFPFPNPQSRLTVGQNISSHFINGPPKESHRISTPRSGY